MKWMVLLVLLFAITVIAQDVSQPDQNMPQKFSEEQPAPVPNAENLDLNDPAVTTTVTVDSVTLPLYIGTLRSDQLAYSIAQSNDGYAQAVSVQ